MFRTKRTLNPENDSNKDSEVDNRYNFIVSLQHEALLFKC